VQFSTSAGKLLHPIPKKEDTELMAVTLSILSRFQTFFTSRLRNKFVLKRLLNTPLHLKRVGTHRCEILMSENTRQSETNVMIITIKS